MSTADGTKRISVDLPLDTHNKLDSFVIWGAKAEVVRSLIELLIKTQTDTNQYIVQDLLAGRCKLTVQSLNNGQGHVKTS